MQPKSPLFTPGSQHPPRFGHAVYLGDYAVSDLDLHCLPTSHKKDTRLIHVYGLTVGR